MPLNRYIHTHSFALIIFGWFTSITLQISDKVQKFEDIYFYKCIKNKVYYLLNTIILNALHSSVFSWVHKKGIDLSCWEFCITLAILLREFWENAKCKCKKIIYHVTPYKWMYPNGYKLVIKKYTSYWTKLRMNFKLLEIWYKLYDIKYDTFRDAFSF